MIYFNNNYSNVAEITQKLLVFLNDYNKVSALNITFTKHDGNIQNQDELYTNIITYLKKNQTEANTIEETEKFKQMIDLITSLIKLFKYENVNSGYTDSPENVPYLKKYLKYKNKYMILKNQK